jgi:hypothetical protein
VVAYTCPAGETTILKDIRLYARAGAVSTADVALQSGSVFVNVVHEGMTAGQTLSRDPWVVLSPGDRIHVQATNTDGLSYWLSGAELEGLAD